MLHMRMHACIRPVVLPCSAVLCQLLTSQVSPQPSLPGSTSLSQMKKSLSKRRLEYMESGHLQTEDAVLHYIQQLDAHRKRCELTGRQVTSSRVTTFGRLLAGTY